MRAALSGATAGDVDSATMRVIEAARVRRPDRSPNWAWDRVGGSRTPVSDRGRRDSARPGAVITVEPTINMAGKFGIRIEDTAIVTDGEPQRVTRGARQLFSK